MTDTPDSEKDRREQEAAQWCARMLSEEADQSRPELEAWLREDARNVAAYNSIREISLLGRKMKLEAKNGASQTEKREKPTGILIIVASALLLGVALLTVRGAWNNQQVAHQVSPKPNPAEPGNALLTSTDRIRSVALRDGSTVTLDPFSRVRLAFSVNQRLLILQHGGARFEVAHQSTPFIVAAGGGTVTARGTIFHVTMTANAKVEVNLIRGRVDVAGPRLNSTSSSSAEPQHLVPGDRVLYDAASPSVGKPNVSAAAARASTERPQTVAELVAASNAASPTSDRIVLGGPDIGALRLSGDFRIHNPLVVAERLAIVFDLGIDRSRPGIITLHRQK